MTNEIPAENVISIEKISMEFAGVYAEPLGKLLMEKINLEMAVVQLKARIGYLSERVKALENEKLLSGQIAAEEMNGEGEWLP